MEDNYDYVPSVLGECTLANEAWVKREDRLSKWHMIRTVLLYLALVSMSVLIPASLERFTGPALLVGMVLLAVQHLMAPWHAPRKYLIRVGEGKYLSKSHPGLIADEAAELARGFPYWDTAKGAAYWVIRF